MKTLFCHQKNISEEDMKVVCIGNSNNLMFSVTRYLRGEGVDAHLIVLSNDDDHFYPECDAFDDTYQEFSKIVSWGHPYNINKIDAENICNDLEEYDYVIACGSGMAYVAKAGLIVDIFIPYGSDLYLSPFYKLARPGNVVSSLFFTFFQRKAIRQAKNIMMDIGAEQMEMSLKKLGYEGNVEFAGIPMLYQPTYNLQNISSYLHTNRFNDVMSSASEESDLLIFHHCRHVWKTTKDPISIKRNDRLIIGLSILKRREPDKKITLVLLEYGADIEASKALVSELELEKEVIWLPKLSRKELMTCLYYADVVAGAFNLSWYSYGVVYESMVMAKPILHYREDTLYEGLYPCLYPMYSAQNEISIADKLQEILHDPEKAVSIGEAAREWYGKYVVDDTLRILKEKVLI